MNIIGGKFAPLSAAELRLTMQGLGFPVHFFFLDFLGMPSPGMFKLRVQTN